jgi:hypothetical protein
MIMRFRPANIRLINRRSNLPRLLLALSSGKSKNNDNDKNNPTYSAGLTGSLHIRANIIRSLVKALGSSAQIRRARFEFRLDKSGAASDDSGVANAKAREYLEKKRGDLLIWGQVLAVSPPILEIRFASAPHDSSNSKRFICDERLELPTEYGVHLGAAIAAMAYSYAAPVQSSGRFVTDTLISASEKLAKLVEEQTLRITDEERALLLYAYAVAEETIGYHREDNLRLSRAIKTYRKLSDIWTSRWVRRDAHRARQRVHHKHLIVQHG